MIGKVDHEDKDPLSTDMRMDDTEIQNTLFFWAPYKSDYYCFEVFDMVNF